MATDSRGRPLTGNVDTVYYSYKYDSVFFFKKENVYKNTAFNSASTSPPIINKLKPYGVWYDKWHDICEL